MASLNICVSMHMCPCMHVCVSVYTFVPCVHHTSVHMCMCACVRCACVPYVNVHVYIVYVWVYLCVMDVWLCTHAPCIHECIMCVSMHMYVHHAWVSVRTYACVRVCPHRVHWQEGKTFTGSWVPHGKLLFFLYKHISANDKCNHYLFRSTAILASATAKAHVGNSDRTWHRWSRIQGCPDTLHSCVFHVPVKADRPGPEVPAQWLMAPGWTPLWWRAHYLSRALLYHFRVEVFPSNSFCYSVAL